MSSRFLRISEQNRILMYTQQLKCMTSHLVVSTKKFFIPSPDSFRRPASGIHRAVEGVARSSLDSFPATSSAASDRLSSFTYYFMFSPLRIRTS